MNAKALRGFQNGQSLVLAEGNGLSFLLRRESAALTSHGVHYRLSRRLSGLSIESGQPQDQGGPWPAALPAAGPGEGER